MKPRFAVPFLAALLVLAGCGGVFMTPPKPDTTAEAFSTAYATLDTAYGLVNIALDNPTTPLPPEKARELVKDIDKVFETVDAMYRMWLLGEEFEGDPVAKAEGILRMTRTMLAREQGGSG